jgi:hypothetical protein
MLRIFILFVLLHVSQYIFSQTDTIVIHFERSGYENVAKEFTKKDYGNTTMICSFPIYHLKFYGNEYRCGDEFEHFIDFSSNPKLQLIFIEKNNSLDYFFEKTAFKDTSKYPFFYEFVFNLVHFNAKNPGKKIRKYLEKNSQDHIFTILDIEGFWTISDGILYKLSPGILRSYKKTDAKRNFLIYGESLINHLIEGKGRGVGIIYDECEGTYDFEKVHISVVVE